MIKIKESVLIQLNQKTEEDIKKYVDSVINKKIIVGELEFLAVKRYLKDLENPRWTFSKKKAFNVINFVQIHCRHIEGALAGKHLKFEPFHKFMLWNIYGFLEKETGYRRFKKA